MTRIDEAGPFRTLGAAGRWVVGLAFSMTAAAGAQLEVAITYDDLPANCTRSDVAVHEQLTAGILDALASAGITAYGFVNEAKLEEEGTTSDARVEILRSWLRAGHGLGNHSYSHPSLFSTPLEAFERDVLKGERVLRPLLAESGLRPEFFRHPFLNTGPTVAIRDAFVGFLAEHGYRVAPVTIDNHEWVYARAYDHALDGGDAALAERVSADYLAYYEQQAQAFLGRPLKHVLLLHANRLNAATNARLFERLVARGYGFIALEHALMDPAYTLPDSYAGRGGISWLHRWALTAGKRGEFFAGEPPAPDWVWAAAGLSAD